MFLSFLPDDNFPSAVGTDECDADVAGHSRGRKNLIVVAYIPDVSRLFVAHFYGLILNSFPPKRDLNLGIASGINISLGTVLTIFVEVLLVVSKNIDSISSAIGNKITVFAPIVERP
jgi:hypothetical protein